MLNRADRDMNWRNHDFHSCGSSRIPNWRAKMGKNDSSSCSEKHSCKLAQRSNSSEQGHTNSAIVSEECKHISGPLHLLKSDSKQTASSDSDSSQGKPNSHFDKKEDSNNEPNVFKNTQHETIVSSKSKFDHPKISDGDLSTKGDGKLKDDVSDQSEEAFPSTPSSYSNATTNSPTP